MGTVTIGSDFRITLPKAVRKRAGITPGDALVVFAFDNRIQLVSVRPMGEMRGFLRGLDLSFRREEDQ